MKLMEMIIVDMKDVGRKMRKMVMEF